MTTRPLARAAGGHYPTDMTKENEIAALAAFTTSLPADSYLRPWLESVQPLAAAAIRADLCPSVWCMDPAAAAAATAAARQDATQIVADARQEAARIVADARDAAARDRRHAAAAAVAELRQAIDRIQRAIL